MSKKSIFTIDLDDSQFKSFVEAFDKFRAKLDDMPEASKKAFDNMQSKTKKTRTEAGDLGVEIHKFNKAMEQFNKTLNSSEKSMHGLVEKSKHFSKNIFGVGKFLMKLGVLGTGLGIGSLFGMDVLGRAAVGGQRNARGIGLRQGQVRAFQADFQRYTNPSLLGNVANAQNDFSKRVYLALAAGTSYQKAATMPVDQLAIQTAIQAHKWWQNTPQSQRTTQTMRARGFEQVGYSLEDMRRLGNTPMRDLVQAQKNYQRDQRGLSISDKTTSEWYKLTRQLNVAGKTIERVLINKLASLAPPLSKLIGALTKDFTSLIQGISPKDLKSFENGIKNIASYLESGKALGAIKNFASSIDSLASMINGITGATKAPSNFVSKHAPSLYNLIGAGETHLMAAFGSKTAQNTLRTQKEKYLSKLENKYQLPKGVLDSVWMQESSRGKTQLSTAGAQGPFQFMPKTAQALGVNNPWNFGSSSAGAARYLSQNLKRFHGDVAKALAAYNMGPTALQKDIATYHDKWRDHLPKETSNYINQVIRRMHDAKKIDLRIENKTGGNIYSSANAMAH